MSARSFRTWIRMILTTHCNVPFDSFQLLSTLTGDFRSDGFGDLLAVKAAVLDEDLVGVHARHNHAGQIDARRVRFPASPDWCAGAACRGSSVMPVAFRNSRSGR